MTKDDLKMKCLNYIKLIGFLFIISATIIITLVIPSKDKKIEHVSSEIERFNSGRVLGAMTSLNVNHIATRKQIDMLQANLLKDSKAAQFLRQRALNRTVTMINNWAGFYVGGDKSITENIKNEIDKIVNDNDINLDTKLKRADEFLYATEEDAFERLSKAHDERNEKKAKLNKFEENRSRWNSGFVWLQILGLILFTGSETIEKIISVPRGNKIVNRSAASKGN